MPRETEMAAPVSFIRWLAAAPFALFADEIYQQVYSHAQVRILVPLFPLESSFRALHAGSKKEDDEAGQLNIRRLLADVCLCLNAGIIWQIHIQSS